MARARPNRQKAKAAAGDLLTPPQSASISNLFGKPITPTPAVPDTAATRILALQQRFRELYAPPPKNLYQSNFFEFATTCITTMDEAKGGLEAKIPRYPYLEEISNAFVERDLLFIEKSRRVLASWLCCTFDVWIAAGGQDPRWPTLMNATANRQIFVGDRKFDSAARFLKRRHKFILGSFARMNSWKLWPEFPTWECKEGEIEFSNNSLITAVAQGADQLRGPGATLAHLEEVAFWEQAQQTIEGLLPIIQGGGRVIAISTPQAATYAKKLVDGTLNTTKSGR